MFEIRIGYELPAQIGRPGMRSREPRKSVLVWVLAACALMCGCPEAYKEGGTTWTAEARSPDGLWLATARSQQWGGPGTAYDATTVYLQWVRGSQPPIQILGFSHQYATMNLKMEWVTPTHLDVTYGPSAGPGDQVSLNFQAIKCANIEISARDLSGGAATSH